MAKFNKVLALCLLALVVGCAAHKNRNRHKIRPVVDPEPFAEGATACTQSLCAGCREVRDLIPRDTIVDITATHYRSDVRFRKAANFIYTNEFADVAAAIEKTDEYKHILRLFKRGQVTLEGMESITGALDCLLLTMPFHVRQRSIVPGAEQSPALPQQESAAESPPHHHMVARSLQTYEVELLNNMPRDDFYDLVQKDIDNNSQFGRLYKVLRSDAFNVALWTGLNSESWADSLKVLRRNNIDVRRLAELTVKLLSWGPQP